MFKSIIAGTALAVLLAGGAEAACAFRNETPLRTLTAAFDAWKAVTAAMAECGNVQSELDQNFRLKQPAAFAATPALYHLGGVSNGTMTPLVNAGTIRPLDELVAKYGQHLTPNQLVRVDGRIMAIAMMVNAQHLVFRSDLLSELGIGTPTTYDEVLAAAEKIKASGKVAYPLGATFKAGWDLAQDFNNLFVGFDGVFVKPDNTPGLNSEAGLKTLDLMKRLSAFMDPEFLVSESTFVQKQFQQGKIAMANLWASRLGALEDPRESQVAGKIGVAAAPAAVRGGKPSTTLWWDGIVIAKNISDAEAEAAFRVALEGLDEEMVRANNNAAVWLVKGYVPSKLAGGAIASATGGAPNYASTTAMGLIHSALGEKLADFMTGKTDARATLAAIEAAYLVKAREQGLIR